MKTSILVLLLALAAMACRNEGGKSKVQKEPASAPTGPIAPIQDGRYEITVTEKGFEPEDVQVPAGKPVTLVFTRKTDKTCAKQFILQMADGSKIEKELPLDQKVELAVTFPTAGKLKYACSMDMFSGTVTVQ